MNANPLIEQLSNELFDALNNATTVTPLTDRHPDISIDDAYQVSLAMLEKRKARGEKLIGKKIGVTSNAVQSMLNVHQPDFGFLTDRMQSGNRVSTAGLIAPKAEGEIAFLLKKDLIGPNVTEQDVLEATGAVMPCFEIVDSRVENWKIKIQDTVADNASCGLFVVNADAATTPENVDFTGCEMIVHKNGEFLSRGTGAEALGNPLTCVAWLANTMAEYGITLSAGDIILSGSLVPLENIKAGDSMSLSISGIGELAIQFVE